MSLLRSRRKTLRICRPEICESGREPAFLRWEDDSWLLTPGRPGRVLVGRDLELAAVREVLNRTAEGQSETLLVFGEAGVGKTALVQHGVAGAIPSTLLLSGACLPLESISVPLLPLRAASRTTTGPRWPRPWPLDGLEAVDKAPSLLDAWLQDVAGSAPVVLLIDDLQEHEILQHLVAGSTYAEIASTLVISEKTVSSHVSNLLRKDSHLQPGRAGAVGSSC